MNFRYATEARADALDLASFYDALSQGLGGKFVSDLDRFIATIRATPRIYARVGRPPRGREVRYGYTKTFYAVVHYEVTATELVILSVVHPRSVRRPWRTRLGP